MTVDPAEIKACCAAAYAQDAVALVLGESYHPGGLTLSRRLADALGPRRGWRVVDVASGPGATARLLAAEYAATVTGVDLGKSTVERARTATERAGLSDSVRFHVGDAESLPLPDGSADAMVCECAFCTFPNKTAAAAEFARVLRPGGRLGITDVVVSERGLPAELATLAAWVACIADARPIDGYVDILATAGLRTRHVEECDQALMRMVEQIDARVRVLRMTDAAGIDIDAVLRCVASAKKAVSDGLIGYRLLIAEKSV